MDTLQTLINRIVQRVSDGLRPLGFDVRSYLTGLDPLAEPIDSPFIFDLSSGHPPPVAFRASALAGSYCLGQVAVESAVVLGSDIRGDELKRAGDPFGVDGRRMHLAKDEIIHIKNSLLMKVLVHHHARDIEDMHRYRVHHTVALPFANIHGSPVAETFLGTGSTVDLTSAAGCVIGEHAYVQAGRLRHRHIPPGRIWIRSGKHYELNYQFDPDRLARYVRHEPGKPPSGEMIRIAGDLRRFLDKGFKTASIHRNTTPTPGTYISPYSAIRGDCRIDGNVLVLQRAYLEDAQVGQGANVQENAGLIRSVLDGLNVTAHGAKIIDARIGTRGFVGFNAFLRGVSGLGLQVGRDSIVLPHTIIDLEAPLDIPPGSLVWGLIRDGRDFENHHVPLADLSGMNGRFDLGALVFRGRGEDFVQGFSKRIDHILEANGAFYDGRHRQGHAQRFQDLLTNVIYAYPRGDRRGLHPTLDFRN